MYTRVVRFTGVDADKMERMLAQIKQADGPPPGINTTGLTVLHDASQGTAVVLQQFSTEADMNEAARIFDAMDAGETPGTRASVDACERRLELEA